MGEAKNIYFTCLNIIFSPWRAPSSHMASLLRLGGGLVAKSTPLLARTPASAAAMVNVEAIPARNASSEEKAAKKKAVAQALDKEMREKHGIISHDEGMKDFTQYETLPVNTHTAAAWDAKDNKNARFMDASKLTVKMHAIDLIAEIPPIASESRIVSCDGGGGALGHPKVFINLDKPGNHACGYCGLRFYLDHHH